MMRRRRGGTPRVANSQCCVWTGGPLDAYYARIRERPMALAVKLADIADNSDPARHARAIVALISCTEGHPRWGPTGTPNLSTTVGWAVLC